MKLTPDEIKVRDLKEAGLTSKAIAERMGISVATVNKIWKSVREKTGADTRAMGRPHADGKTRKKNGGKK